MDPIADSMWPTGSRLACRRALNPTETTCYTRISIEMERASKLLGDSRLAKRICSREQIAHAAWRAAVGKRLAAHTHPAWLNGASLVIEVADDIWAAQLEPLKPQILGKLAAIAGSHLVRDFELRVSPRRRTMSVETRAARGGQERLPLEEARERAADPVLDRIYQTSRRRALAG